MFVTCEKISGLSSEAFENLNAVDVCIYAFIYLFFWRNREYCLFGRSDTNYSTINTQTVFKNQLISVFISSTVSTIALIENILFSFSRVINRAGKMQQYSLRILN